MTIDTIEKWEKEFFDRFVAVKEYYGKDKPCTYRKIFANEIDLPFKVLNFIRKLLSQAREEEKRKFVNILDTVLSSVHESGAERIEGRNLNGAMFHYFVHTKLSTLASEERKV